VSELSQKDKNNFIVELKQVDRQFEITAISDDFDKKSMRTDKLNALTKVSLGLKSGEFVFLTGPSGAGKSTLLRLILGLDDPTHGEVYTLGHPMHEYSESQRRKVRREVGVIFQDHRLISSLNVFENVELPLIYSGMNSVARRSRVIELLEIVQMREHLKSQVKVLSAGEKQRVGIARALALAPSLIVADEPTGNLDPQTARSLVRMLKELKGSGTTVLIATHDMSLVRDFGGRVLEIVSGSFKARQKIAQTKAYKVPGFWGDKDKVSSVKGKENSSHV